VYKKLNWQAYTSGNRNKITDKIKDVISHNEGCILNFTQFSDLALSLSIEIEEQHIIQLHDALAEIITIDDLDQEQINQGSEREWILFLNISFSQGSGDMKIIVPTVPG